MDNNLALVQKNIGFKPRSNKLLPMRVEVERLSAEDVSLDFGLIVMANILMQWKRSTPNSC